MSFNEDEDRNGAVAQHPNLTCRSITVGRITLDEQALETILVNLDQVNEQMTSLTNSVDSTFNALRDHILEVQLNMNYIGQILAANFSFWTLDGDLLTTQPPDIPATNVEWLQRDTVTGGTTAATLPSLRDMVSTIISWRLG